MKAPCENKFRRPKATRKKISSVMTISYRRQYDTSALLLLLIIHMASGQENPLMEGVTANTSSSSFLVLRDATNANEGDNIQTHFMESSTLSAGINDQSSMAVTSVEVSAKSAVPLLQTDEDGNSGSGGVFHDNTPTNTGTDMSAHEVGDTATGLPVELINEPGKRRQYLPRGPVASAFDPGFLNAPGPAMPAPPPSPGLVGTCPSGGPSLPIECDPKRPWPQCPPQSYCYATNTVDIGPYFCCPIWSTYGAAWRPATPFYSYAPPPPPNWPEVLRFADPRAVPIGYPRKSRKEPRSESLVDVESAVMPQNDMLTENQLKVQENVSDWVQRQPLTNDPVPTTDASVTTTL